MQPGHSAAFQAVRAEELRMESALALRPELRFNNKEDNDSYERTSENIVLRASPSTLPRHGRFRLQTLFRPSPCQTDLERRQSQRLAEGQSRHGPQRKHQTSWSFCRRFRKTHLSLSVW